MSIAGMISDQSAESQRLQLIGQLAAGIAHEINTPTQYIGDNLRFLRDAFADLRPLLSACLAARHARPGDQNDESMLAVRAAVDQSNVSYLIDELPTAIGQSLEGVDHVVKIVRSLKDLSYRDHEQKQLTDVNRIIESVLTISCNEWKYFAAATTDLAADLPPVMCLPGRLHQALLNLVINAAHAIEAKLGQGTSEKGNIAVRSSHNGDWVQIDVQDTGTGIPDDIRDKIFDPFFTTKSADQGTGQGLAITREIVVDRHEGTLTFETDPGRGTTFTVRLPIHSSFP